jgi:hypothetical protein
MKSFELKHPDVVFNILDGFKRTVTFIAAGQILLLSNLGNTLLSGEPQNAVAFRILLGAMVFGVAAFLWIAYAQRRELIDFACHMPATDREFLIKKRSELTISVVLGFLPVPIAFILVSMLFK